MEHTPEPWEVGTNKPPFYAGETVIIGQKESQPFILDQCNHNFDELSTANARRIVARTNACAGIPTEDLEGRAVFDEFVLDKERAEADRDRWKALAVEAGGELKELAAFSGKAITALDLKAYGEARSHLKVINQACARLYAKIQEAQNE